MELQIGNRIRELRKASGMTQEQLAELIGISFQAVSKWENNIALPDISLVPTLARIFGVATDEIFAYNLTEMHEEIERYVSEAAMLRESDPKEGRRILEEGLQKYPDNDILLNNLLYVLDYSKNPDETIRTASRLIDKTTESDIRYDALRFLAYAYSAKGDTDSAVKALEQIPEIYFSKLSEMAFILTGKTKFTAAEKQKWLSFETLLQMMQKIAACYKDEGNSAAAAAEIERALALIAAMEGEEKIRNFSNYADFFEKELQRIKEK